MDVQGEREWEKFLKEVHKLRKVAAIWCEIRISSFKDIHTSRDPAFLPNCGHLLHMSCYKGLLSKGIYQCPQCQTSLANIIMLGRKQIMRLACGKFHHISRTSKSR